MERVATAPEPQATFATAPHLGRPMPPEAARQKSPSSPSEPYPRPAQARGRGVVVFRRVYAVYPSGCLGGEGGGAISTS